MSRVLCVLKTNEGGLWAVPQLQEIERRGHQVAVLIPPGDGKLRRSLGELGINVIDSEFSFRFWPILPALVGLVRLRRQLRAFKPDVLFYHLYASALATRLASLGISVRRVHMVAGPLYLDSRVIRAVERILCRLDDVVIGGSEHTAERYRGLRMPRKRVVAIPYGTNPIRFTPAADSRLNLLGVREDQFLVVMVAYVYAPKASVYRGVGIKGHELLLAAWQKVSAQLSGAHLVLVGSGFDEPGETYRQQLLDRFNVRADDTITWLTSVEDVRDYYACADVSVSPSLSENHGAALEASAMGVPSIVSDAGALPETVVDGRSGWIVPAGTVDALAEALVRAHGAWRRGEIPAMGDAARQHLLDNFDQQRCVSRVVDVVLA